MLETPGTLYTSYQRRLDSRRVFVSYKQKYVLEVLVNCLVKLAQDEVWLGELTIPAWPQLLTGV